MVVQNTNEFKKELSWTFLRWGQDSLRTMLV